MVKLDVKVLRYLTKDEFRVLTAIEMGMKNHEMVPIPLINLIAQLKFGGTHKALETLHKNKLLWHSRLMYEGYRLTYAGYDFLAIKTLCSRGSIAGVGTKVGVGKESDVYICINDAETKMIMKLHRLGRTSFKTIKANRDYLQHRKSASWLYMSRLAALKEYAYMKALYDNGFPVPTPIDVSRHCVIMSVVDGYPLCQVRHLRHPGKVFNDCMNLILKIASYGLIHGDFNEFNLLISDNEEITMIDFPQMVSTSHMNAEMYFDRDVACIRTCFSRRFGYEADSFPTFKECVKTHDLDVLVTASGFTKEHQQEFEELTKEEQTDHQEGAEEKANEVEEDEEDDESEDEIEAPQQELETMRITDPNQSDDEKSAEIEKIDNRKKPQKASEPETVDPSEADDDLLDGTSISIDTQAITNNVRIKLAKTSKKSNINSRKRNVVKSRAKKEIRDTVRAY